MQTYTIDLFLDCDGVLADFDSYARHLFGVRFDSKIDDHSIPDFWKRIHEHGDFYNKLPLMPDARYLVDSVRPMQPRILTGVPKYLHTERWSEPQKQRWAERHFPGIEVLTCLSEEKCKFITTKPAILIDDRPHYRHLWEQANGIFILHTSAEDSICQLKQVLDNL